MKNKILICLFFASFLLTSCHYSHEQKQATIDKKMNSTIEKISKKHGESIIPDVVMEYNKNI